MYAEKFATLVHELCAMYKLDPAHVLNHGPLEMGGLTFFLLHDKEADSPLMMMYADFGNVPEELETKVYKKLLESNLSNYSGQGETFCMGPDGRIVFANNFELELLTPQLLATHLAMTSLYAKQWRKDHFLGEEDPSKKKPWRGAHLAKQMQEKQPTQAE